MNRVSQAGRGNGASRGPPRKGQRERKECWGLRESQVRLDLWVILEFREV